jgi:tetratricopeptide (TPR) repeat protein
MITEMHPDIAKAIRQSNAPAISALMFDPKNWQLRSGYCTETEYWDYKITGPSPGAGTAEEWAELAKDVLAFHNNKGGVIVFGVGNGFKVVGYRNELDSKLLNDRLRRYIGDQVWLDYHRLNIKQDQTHIGMVIVPPRGPVILRFLRDSPCDGGKYLFRKGDSAIREGDSSKLLKDTQADAFEARSRAPEFGQFYAIDEPFFRILNPEYHDFIERVEPCRLIEKALQDPRTSVTQITGVGGAGKTALATWAVLRAYEKKQFGFIVSTTAKDRELTAHGIQSLSPKLTSFESLLNSVLDVLGFPELKSRTIDEKEKEVRELLHNSGGLLFVDNLETVDDARIIRLLDDLPVGVRALVTSRRDAVRVAVFPVQLEWLKEDEGRAFIRSLGHLPGLSFLLDLPDAECETIRKACDGLPLAIRWAVARAKNAAEAIKIADAITNSGKLGEELLEFSFRRVFDSLSKDERSLLQVLSLFQQPQPSEVLYVGSGISHLRMQDTISALIKDALIQRYFDEERNDYTYLLLPLTRTFVYNQVKGTGNLETDIRNRLKNYFDAQDVADAAERVIVRELRQGRSESESGLIDLAIAADRRGDTGTARELLEQALSRNPKNFKAAQLLAELHRHKFKSMTDALRLYEQAASCAPSTGKTRAKIFREWGMILRHSGQIDATDRAIEKFQEALVHAPRDEFTIFAMAQCLERKGMYARAIPLLESIAGTPYSDTKGKVWPLLHTCYERQGDIVAAAELRARMRRGT